LCGYFGEQLPEACGHCSWCATRRAQPVQTGPAPTPIQARLDVRQFRRVCAANPRALGEPRQQARFLCGLSSPALTSARLTADPLFGVLGEHRFADVLGWRAGTFTDPE
jgi:ATP-dependent DNA helicase RecQ